MKFYKMLSNGIVSEITQPIYNWRALYHDIINENGVTKVIIYS